MALKFLFNLRVRVNSNKNISGSIYRNKTKDASFDIADRFRFKMICIINKTKLPMQNN